MSEPAINLSPEPPVSHPIVPQPSATSIFRGPNGIRAGWRVLIFLGIAGGVLGVVYLALALAARLLGGSVGFNPSAVTPLGLSILEITLFLLPTTIAAAIMARIEHRKPGDYGLPAKFAFRKDFWIGTSIGFLAISASLLAIFALHGFRLTGLATHGSAIVTSIASWSAAFVVVGLSEEFAFRGYLQFTLTTGAGFWPSAVLMSLLFGYVHSGNLGETKFGLFSVVLFGVLFCFFLRRTGNLWWAVGFHAGWDWGQTFFYGVADSGIAPYHNLFNSTFSGPVWLTGGSVGPEASIFTPLTLLLVAIIFSRFYRENRYNPLGAQT
jgi:membrane protease YdiL (CAAX protease family)